jgi:hypothetical protein
MYQSARHGTQVITIALACETSQTAHGTYRFGYLIEVDPSADEINRALLRLEIGPHKDLGH